MKLAFCLVCAVVLAFVGLLIAVVVYFGGLFDPPGTGTFWAGYGLAAAFIAAAAGVVLAGVL